MSDCIMPEDITYSTICPEWHGKANFVKPEEIKPEMERNIFPIQYRKIELYGKCESGKEISFPGRSLCVADASTLPVDLRRERHPQELTPLACPGDVFEPLQNSLFFESVFSAFERLGLAFPLVTGGTLCSMAKFYFSVECDSLGFKGPDGKEIKGYLNFLNAANGENCAAMILEFFRVVCHNTYMATLNGFSDLKIFGKHTKNGIIDFLDAIARNIEAMHDGQKMIVKAFEKLADAKISREMALAIADGYSFQTAIKNGEKISDGVELTTQAMRASDSIVDLAWNGRGNHGGDLYQLFQGATDFWTNGDGVGSERVGLSKRISRGKWGSAAKHKADFADYLFSGDLVTSAAIGKRARDNKLAIAKN